MKTPRVSLLLGVSVLLLLSGLSISAGVEVYEGEESVLLPFQVSESDSSGSTVMWNRFGLTFRSVVHFLKPEGEHLSDQDPQYHGRTSMRTDALQTGDLSLTLRKPTNRDSGTYTCTVRRRGQELSRTTVHLLVREPPCVSVVRLVLHLVVFCPFFMSTGLMVSICCSRRTGNKPVVSMEMSQDVEEDQGLDKDHDDITADVTTEHNF
ncbi:myelin-oligodendrocyte glycoprotein-like [Channa argus]|uniref:myelin-oligodendrocyte glycoprotein-like n=1 Tax=Channa argus TaxID=215402 RepID=UPI00351FC166